MNSSNHVELSSLPVVTEPPHRRIPDKRIRENLGGDVANVDTEIKKLPNRTSQQLFFQTTKPINKKKKKKKEPNNKRSLRRLLVQAKIRARLFNAINTVSSFALYAGNTSNHHRGGEIPPKQI
jgi:hypothetical protein